MPACPQSPLLDADEMGRAAKLHKNMKRSIRNYDMSVCLVVNGSKGLFHVITDPEVVVGNCRWLALLVPLQRPQHAKEEED
jgi:hypothetical protein